MRWYRWPAPSWWRLELKKDESKRMDIDDFLETVRRYTDAATITRRMVAELIDHIEVYHAEKQDGVTNQRVVIYYNCIGAFDVPDRRKIPEADIIMETRKGVALSTLFAFAVFPLYSKVILLLYFIASLHKFPAGRKCSPVGLIIFTFWDTIRTPPYNITLVISSASCFASC